METDDAPGSVSVSTKVDDDDDDDDDDDNNVVLLILVVFLSVSVVFSSFRLLIVDLFPTKQLGSFACFILS